MKYLLIILLLIGCKTTSKPQRNWWSIPNALEGGIVTGDSLFSFKFDTVIFSKDIPVIEYSQQTKTIHLLYFDSDTTKHRYRFGICACWNDTIPLVINQ